MCPGHHRWIATTFDRYPKVNNLGNRRVPASGRLHRYLGDKVHWLLQYGDAFTDLCAFAKLVPRIVLHEDMQCVFDRDKFSIHRAREGLEGWDQVTVDLG